MLENLNSYLDDPIDGNKQDDEVEIDLLEIFYVLKSKFLILLTVGLLVGCLCGVFTKFAMTPVYTSTSSILVLSKETTLTSLADIQLGTSLTSDYTVLIKCTPVLEQVIKNLELDIGFRCSQKQHFHREPIQTAVFWKSQYRMQTRNMAKEDRR